jgi:cystinosin
VEYYEYWNPITVLGYAKLTITLIKYTPPAVWNCKRKSTKGWSIFNIVLDLIGGVFSMTSGGLSAENGLNLTKVILGFITIVYDVLFCIQHYCLFRNSEEENDQKLIDDSNGILETVDGPLSGSGTK